MDRKSVEFDATVDKEGRITLPGTVIKEVGKSPIHVRLTMKSIHSDLKERSVSEDEIERIGAIQLEPREQVVKFLLSEGVLKRSSLRSRTH
ncbi:MAG: hypothetical protein HW412_2152 [Bacteroidetes bacterium]|nr:hypothetical protein [Bacteroidota bacterium]